MEDGKPKFHEFEYTPDLVDLGGGKVIDEGKLGPLLDLMMRESSNAERIAEVRVSHPGIMVELDAADPTRIEASLMDGDEKVLIGRFGIELLDP